MKKKSTAAPAALAAPFGRFAKARVLVVGDVIQDVFIWGKVRRISPEAPVPVVEITGESSMLGGAANVVNNLVALEAHAALAGVVGKDRAGDEVRKGLAAIGADRTMIVRSAGRPTPVKTRVIAQKQQVVRFDKEVTRPLGPGAEKALWAAIDRGLDRTDAVIVSDYAKGTITAGLMARLVEACRQRKILLAVDPKPAHADWYKGAGIVTPNHQEAAEIAGIELTDDADLERGGAALLEQLETDAVLITRGEKGMSLFRPRRPPVHVPALAREVFDVTGAGDTVIATLVVAMVAGMDLVDAVKLANLAAGIVVGKVGTSVATVAELKVALQKNGGRPR